MERAARRPELVERPIIYGICHLRRREGADGKIPTVAPSPDRPPRVGAHSQREPRQGGAESP